VDDGFAHFRKFGLHSGLYRGRTRLGLWLEHRRFQLGDSIEQKLRLGRPVLAGVFVEESVAKRRAAQRCFEHSTFNCQPFHGRHGPRLQWISAVCGSFRHGGGKAIVIRSKGQSVAPEGQGKRQPTWQSKH
jgi:hypothetical protein